MLSKHNRKYIKDLSLIFFSSVIYAVSVKYFIEPAHLLPAGFGGLSQLVSLLLDRTLGINIQFMVIYICLQLVVSLVVIKFIGRKFALYSVFQFSLSTLLVFVLPEIKLTSDLILLSVFGGVLSGYSSILAFKAGASTGGTDFIAIYVLNRKNFPIFNYIMFANFAIIGLTGIFISLEIAMYSIILQFVTTVCINNLHLSNKLQELVIITDKPTTIISKLHGVSKRGITEIKAKGAYSNQEKTILLMITNKLEQMMILDLIKKADPEVFIGISSCESVVGKFSIEQVT